MRIHSLLFLACCVATIYVGCGEPPNADTGATSVNSTPNAQVILPPRHSKIEVFCNMRTSPDAAFDNEDGCSLHFTPPTPEEGEEIGHSFRCGYQGAVSEISIDYTHSDENGDHYHFERLFPHEETGQKRSEVDVVFNGSEVVLFEDEAHRIVMRISKDDSLKQTP